MNEVTSEPQDIDPRHVIIRKAGDFTDVDPLQRIVELIAVPWGQEAQVFWRGEMWREVIERGAFDSLRNVSDRIRVNREHIRGRTVGKVESFDPDHPDGLFARVKIVKGPEGDAVLNLAEENMISASIGYVAQKPSDLVLDKRSVPKSRVVKRAYLDHLSMVESPAYEGARVLAVREGPSGRAAEEPLPATPNLDDLMHSDVFVWARERIGKKG